MPKSLGDHLFFVAGPESDPLLWVTDGTAAGTRLAQDIFPGPSPSAPEQLTAVPGKLFFTANDGVHGRELWVETSLP